MTTPKWLTDEEARAWLNVAAVLELMPATLDSQLIKDAGLTYFDFFTLAQLAEAPERMMRVSDLAEQTNASVARLSRVATRLEAAGYIERVANNSDGRSRYARLTDDGVRKLAEAAPGHIALIRRLVIDALTPQELDGLGVVCARLLQVLDPDRQMLAQTRTGRHGRPGLQSDPRP